jgi:hypothetical protein
VQGLIRHFRHEIEARIDRYRAAKGVHVVKTRPMAAE